MVHTLFAGFVDWIMHHGGLYMILFVLFAETGLFVGFFLPGDSLLFAAGIYVKELAAAFFNAPFYVIFLLLSAAAAMGSYLGYLIGKGAGGVLLRKKDSFLFKKKHLYQAKHFYERHGKITVFLSRFLPVIRTFAPLVAGMVRMPLRIFSLYNVAGSLCWVALLGCSGYFLESFILQRYHFDLKDHIAYITLIIILVTTVPVIVRLFIHPKNPGQPR